MAVVRLILRLSSSRPRPLAAVPALLRLVVVPRLNAHKRHVRDPPPFPITLPGFLIKNRKAHVLPRVRLNVLHEKIQLLDKTFDATRQ